jgi:hypothetical protein
MRVIELVFGRLGQHVPYHHNQLRSSCVEHHRDPGPVRVVGAGV